MFFVALVSLPFLSSLGPNNPQHWNVGMLMTGLYEEDPVTEGLKARLPAGIIARVGRKLLTLHLNILEWE